MLLDRVAAQLRVAVYSDTISFIMSTVTCVVGQERIERYVCFSFKNKNRLFNIMVAENDQAAAAAAAAAVLTPSRH